MSEPEEKEHRARKHARDALWLIILFFALWRVIVFIDASTDAGAALLVVPVGIKTLVHLVAALIVGMFLHSLLSR